MMTILCSWCGATLGTKPGPEGTTHTICPSCLSAQFAPGEHTAVLDVERFIEETARMRRAA